jgi:ribosomal protein S18 acetylase RimI-like enzyme
MEIRPIDSSDAAALDAFFRRIPEGERAFFKEDVLDADVQASICRPTTGRRQVAVDGDGSVAGYVAVIPGLGWSSHVGEIRLVVDPPRRQQGLGRELARRALVDALELGLSKVFVEVVADQTPAVAMFQALGFQAEALLKDHARDRAGELRDLLMLAHSAGDNWSSMATLGIEEALT